MEGGNYLLARDATLFVTSRFFCFLSFSVCFGPEIKSNHNSSLSDTDSTAGGFLQLLYGIYHTSYDTCMR